jgi:hypothetical protein
MVRRLTTMRLLESGRLFDRWWLIAVDGTLQDRGHDTQVGEARYHYVLTASLVGPYGMSFPLMSEFMDMHDPVRDKEDCELKAFGRLAEHLRVVFPRRPICLLLDGLYPVKNDHLIMQVAFILWQLLAKGVLHRLTQACRKVSDVKLVELLRLSLLSVLISSDAPSFRQLRFYSSA